MKSLNSYLKAGLILTGFLTVFIILGLVSAVLYGFLYVPDKKTFPKLYQ